LLALAAILLAGAQGVGPVTALLLRGLNRLAAPLPLRQRLPLREASRGLGRAQLALAALVVALATAVGMTIMVSSFRLTVADWLEDRLDAPVLARGQALGAARGPLEEVLEAARQDGLVSGWVWRQSVDDWLEGLPVRATLLEAVGREAPTLRLSEPLARQLGRTEGGAVVWPGRLPGAEPLASYYRSYGGGRLELEMPRALWQGPAPAGPWGLAVYGAPEALLPRLQTALPSEGELLAQGPVKARALAIFDRTFRVTAVLQTIAGVVAGVGLLSAFAALALDRRQQLSALRILGAPGPFAARQLLLEAGLLAAVAGVLALPLGALAAWVLCDAVNLRAFHWTLTLHWPPLAFLEALLLALGAGLLAALGPALQAWRAPTSEALEVLRAQG
jgi:putative ABC transport system permease protein